MSFLDNTPAYPIRLGVFEDRPMKRVMRKVARKIRRHHHKKHLSFLQALRLYGGMSVAA